MRRPIDAARPPAADVADDELQRLDRWRRLARVPWPRTLPPAFIPMRPADRAVHDDHRPDGHGRGEHAVDVERVCARRLDARPAPPGGTPAWQPAITALIATFSTVHSTRSGGTTATISSGARVVPSSMRSTRASVGATTGRPSVQPRSNRASASSSSVGDLDAAAAQHRPAEAHREHVDDVWVDRQRAAARPELGQVRAERRLPGRALPRRARASRRCARPRTPSSTRMSVGTVSMSWWYETERSSSCTVPIPAGKSGSSWRVHRQRHPGGMACSAARVPPARRSRHSALTTATSPSGRGSWPGVTLTRRGDIGHPLAALLDVSRTLADPRGNCAEHHLLRRAGFDTLFRRTNVADTAETRPASGSKCPARDPSSWTWARACGTSARPSPRRQLRGTALVSHLHWDHVQGLPFFVPILTGGHARRVCAGARGRRRPVRGVRLVHAVLRSSPSRWPPCVGTFAFHHCAEGEFSGRHGEGDVSQRLPMSGRHDGYRIEWEGATVAYIPDHQQPEDGGYSIAEGALELVDGADLVIHDAQYTVAEFPKKSTWGHCTVEYAVMRREGGRCEVARAVPPRPDSARRGSRRAVDVRCVSSPTAAGVELITAAEGLTVSFG